MDEAPPSEIDQLMDADPLSESDQITDAVRFVFQREPDENVAGTLMHVIAKQVDVLVGEYSDIGVYEEAGKLVVLSGDAALDDTDVYRLTPDEIRKAAESVEWLKRYL